MNEETERFRFDAEGAPPSETVVDAVSFVTGADSVGLESLYEVVDPDALDRVLSDADDGTVTFRLNGVHVRAHASGDVSVVPPSTPRTEGTGGGSNVLMLSDGEGTDPADSTAGLPDETESLLGVAVSPSATDLLSGWRTTMGEMPAQTAIVSVGEVTRSASESATVGSPANPVPVETLAATAGLDELTGTVGRTLREWGTDASPTAVCVHSLTDVVERGGRAGAVRFVEALVARVQTHGAVARYYLDPEAHDDRTVAALRPFFDDVVGGTGRRWRL